MRLLRDIRTRRVVLRVRADSALLVDCNVWIRKLRAWFTSASSSVAWQALSYRRFCLSKSSFMPRLSDRNLSRARRNALSISQLAVVLCP